MTRTTWASAAAALLLGSLPVHGASAAVTIPYAPEGSHGVYNATTYTFTAAHTGSVKAYFAGAWAAYTSEIGMLVNGVSTGVFGLNDHTSSIGQQLNLGHVHAGDTIVFVLDILNLGKTVYSDPSMNLGYDHGAAKGSIGGHNHIFSTAYTASASLPGVPTGTYVAFEDQSFPHSDYDYNDQTFVFTNIADPSQPTPSGVPEPATWAMMLLGIGGLGGVLRASRAGRAAAIG